MRGIKKEDEREVNLLSACVYMHRGVEERKRSVGRCRVTRQVETIARDEGAREEGRETACEPHFPMHSVRLLHWESAS